MDLNFGSDTSPIYTMPKGLIAPVQIPVMNLPANIVQLLLAMPMMIQPKVKGKIRSIWPFFLPTTSLMGPEQTQPNIIANGEMDAEIRRYVY